ncbi:MAG TPA: lysine biosynthesis protein LysW [Actinocrinis sp.]|nr:lysine biosynthesis protein LysW [Actinocrinis sp.]
MAAATVVQCPECRGSVHVPEDVMAAEVVVCGECASELEVVAVAPVVLAFAPEVEEDWGE